jgi:hypothetical protein
MQNWNKFANNLQELERKERSHYRIIQHKVNQAYDITIKRLLDTPHATQTMINKITNFTIVVPRNPPGILDSNELYKAYFPHLQIEIQRREVAGWISAGGTCGAI